MVILNELTLLNKMENAKVALRARQVRFATVCAEQCFRTTKCTVLQHSKTPSQSVKMVDVIHLDGHYILYVV